MENYLRISLLLLMAVLVILMLLESRSRRRTKTSPLNDTNKSTEKCEHLNEPTSVNDLIVISIMAKPSQSFASYDLLQCLSSAGMQYGEMKIFHYYSNTQSEKFPLFSLATATEPGFFDMDMMGGFSCSGLTLFMNMRDVPDAASAFELMRKTAEQLADDLDGELRAGQKHIWNDEVVSQYREKALQYAQ